MERWVVNLQDVTSTGDLTQLYPDFAAVGIAPSSATPSQQVRHPCEGTLTALQVKTNGTDGGTLQVYDINGWEVGADVSSATAITNAQLTTALADGRAKLIFEQNFAGSGLTPFTPIGPARFLKGLAARFVGSAGEIELNLTVQGGYRYLNGVV